MTLTQEVNNELIPKWIGQSQVTGVKDLQIQVE